MRYILRPYRARDTSSFETAGRNRTSTWCPTNRAAIAVVSVLLLGEPGDSLAQAPVLTGNLLIEEAWAGPAQSGIGSVAAYVIINNQGDIRDRLVSVESPMAESAIIHQRSMRKGAWSLAALPSGIDIPAQADLIMSPAGVHIVLAGLKQPLRTGSEIPLILTFRDGRQARIQATMKTLGFPSPGHHHHG